MYPWLLQPYFFPFHRSRSAIPPCFCYPWSRTLGGGTQGSGLGRGFQLTPQIKTPSAPSSLPTSQPRFMPTSLARRAQTCLLLSAVSHHAHVPEKVTTPAEDECSNATAARVDRWHTVLDGVCSAPAAYHHGCDSAYLTFNAWAAAAAKVDVVTVAATVRLHRTWA